MPEIFIMCNYQLKYFWNNHDLTYNVGYFTCTDEYLSADVDTH